MQAIIEKNYNCLYELGFTHEKISELVLHELKGYEFVENAHELQTGRHIRWICLKEKSEREKEIKISRGAIFCRFKNDQSIVCKSYGNGIYFHLDPEDCFVFEKMSTEERIVATAMDFASHNQK